MSEFLAARIDGRIVDTHAEQAKASKPWTLQSAERKTTLEQALFFFLLQHILRVLSALYALNPRRKPRGGC